MRRNKLFNNATQSVTRDRNEI